MGRPPSMQILPTGESPPKSATNAVTDHRDARAILLVDCVEEAPLVYGEVVHLGIVARDSQDTGDKSASVQMPRSA